MPRSAQDGLPFVPPPFDGFGPSRFHPDGAAAGGHRIDGQKPSQLKTELGRYDLRSPGIYAMLDPRGRVIYVGKAKCLRTRLACYFRGKSRDPKAARIIRQTRSLLWEFAADELGALLRELELIQRFRPRYNVLGLPGLRRYRYIALGRGEAPYVYVTRQPTRNNRGIWGPFVGRARVDAAVRRLNDYYRLRDCSISFPMAFSDDKPLFDSDKAAGCLRHELGTCLGPCGGGCTRSRYLESVNKVQGFLEGRDRSALAVLKNAMTAAASAMQFERAANLRDKLADLEWLDLRLAMLRRSRHESAYVYPVISSNGRELWYLLNQGRIWGVIWAPTNFDERLNTIDLLQAILRERASAPVTVTTVDSVLLVLAWFRKHPQEKNKLERTETILDRLQRQNSLAA